MSREVKARVRSILLLLAVALSPRARGSAVNGNRSEDLGVRTEPRGDRVYLEVNGVAEGGGYGGQWVRQMQTDTTNTSPHVWTSRVDEVPHPRSKVLGSKPPQFGLGVLQKDKTPIQALQSTEEPRPQQGASDREHRLQSDFPGHEDTEDYITQLWIEMSPSVQCSGGAMTLTAQGVGYSQLFVERVNAAPLHVLQLLPDCGYFVRATWRDILLTASFDACYILKENDSYVLPLLWWGRLVKISCPMIPDEAPAPSGFCSDFGMTLIMEVDEVAVEKFKVKVNGELVPFVLDTCACRVESPPEYVVFFISFTAPCVKDGGGTLHVLLDQKEYEFSCPQSTTSSQQPFQPTQAPSTTIPQLPLGFDPINFPNPFLMGPHLPGEMPNLQYSYSDLLALSGGAPGTRSQLHKYSPVSYIPQLPGTPGTPAASKPMLPPFSPPFGQYHPVLGPAMDYQFPPVPHPIQHQQKPPRPPPDDHEAPEHHKLDITTRLIVTPHSVQKNPQTHPVTPVTQEAPVVQLPPRAPVLPTTSTKMEPSLTCKGHHLVADLPSAKMDSLKVKDVAKKNRWLPVVSAPSHCGYSLQRKDQGVIFSSPLPTCHSKTLSSSLITLSLKFWDIVQLRHRVLQLRCPAADPPAPSPPKVDLEAPWTLVTESLRPKPELTSFQPARSPPLASLSQIERPVDLSFYQPKPTSYWAETTPVPAQPFVPHVQCLSQHMSVTLPYRSVSGLTVLIPSRGDGDNLNGVLLSEAPVHCGYLVKENHNGFINVILPYTSCHMAYLDGQYRITLAYQSEDGHGVEALLSCQVPKGQECNLPAELQLDCGPSSISAEDCNALGCCYSSSNGVCYYPMDECTADRHFVFSIPSTLTDPPLSPALLVAAGNSSCIPQRVVGDSALFKIPLDGCGAHKYEVGKTVIYLLEILNTLQSLSLNYGTITRDSPIRLLVECRFVPGTLASVSYLVKSPSLGPSVQAQGVFGVQLRIAKDKHYSSYYPQYHRPLTKLLGKPLYLEVRLLNAPDPSVMLLVHYCVAYPRSAHSAWVLIYDGCPNPLDVTPTNNPPPPPPEAVANHVRRFTISTFQFLDPNKDQPGASEKQKEEEEIYFMCATEVCLPSEGQCVEGCFENALTTKS